MSRVYPTFESMLDDGAFRPADLTGPARFPVDKMVFKVYALNAPKLFRMSREPGLKSRVVISKRPDFSDFARRHLNLMEKVRGRFQLIIHVGMFFPPDWCVPGNGGRVYNISVHHDGGWFEFLAESDECPLSGGRFTWPYVSITTY